MGQVRQHFWCRDGGPPTLCGLGYCTGDYARVRVDFDPERACRNCLRVERAAAGFYRGMWVEKVRATNPILAIFSGKAN